MDGERSVAADPLERPFLQEAEQLRLHRRPELRDLVEEQGPAVGEFDPSLLARESTGEGAFLVAEQLALEEGLRDRGAVDRDERGGTPRTEVVKGAGDQLFPRSRLPLKEDRRVGRGDLLNLPTEIDHRLRFPDDPREPEPLGELLAEEQVLLEERPSLHRPPQQKHEMVGIDRLRNEVERPPFHRSHRVLHGPVRGHHDHGQIRVGFARRGQNRVAVFPRKAEIGDDRGEPPRGERRDRLGPVRRFRDLEPLRFEGRTKHRSKGVAVLDEEHGGHRPEV